MSTTATTTNAFLAWFSQWGNVIYAFGQLVFWASLSMAALMSAIQFKRFVSHKVGADTAVATESDTAEEFVK